MLYDIGFGKFWRKLQGNRIGNGPGMSKKAGEVTIRGYDKPAGGWDALSASGHALWQQGLTKGARTLLQANQPSGFDCPGCAWPDPPHGAALEFCENGVKAVAAETTRKRLDDSFFAQYRLTELRQHSDHWLENQGRLTQPLLYDAERDGYISVGWQQAFSMIGECLRGLPNPDQAVFYASGRTSNEAAFLYQLFARQFGTNNLPDSSNLCHEPSGMAMREVLGVGKGTCTLEDFQLAKAIFVIGQNPGTNHPRMLAALRSAHQRGCRIVVFNPLRERGLERFTHPQSVTEMLTGRSETLADYYYQLRIGGDIAALKGMMRCLFEADERTRVTGKAPVIDYAFIEEHTQGFAALRTEVLAESWALIEQESGLTRAQISEAAEVYMQADSTIVTWCMGVTHHEYATSTVQMITNLLLLRGNIGRPGAGAVPVRGHSNVQGDRTMGVTTRPGARFLENLHTEFGFAPPTLPGLDAVQSIKGMLDGSVRAFIGLGGNFGAAAPDSYRTYAAFSGLGMTVHIATKLNRSHLYPGRLGLILPCLGRTELDLQDGRAQFITVEDSMSMVHASRGSNPPASSELRSEPAIVAGMAHATMGAASIAWPALGSDYNRIREHIESVQRGVVDGFTDFNRRIHQPRGFRLPNKASQRLWATASGKAEFRMHAIPQDTLIQRARDLHGERVLTLMTIRSHDQYNTTVYGLDDRYRGVFGGRNIVFICAEDLLRLGFADGEQVNLRAASLDGIERRVHGFRLVRYNIPQGCLAGYFPELTPLVALELSGRGSNTPTSKAVPVLLERIDAGAGLTG